MRDQDWIPQQKYCPMGKGLYSISDFPRRPKCGTGQTPVRRLPQLLQGPQCLFLEVCSIDSDQKANSDQYRKLPNAQIKIPPVCWNFRIILSSSNVFCVQEAKSEKKIQMHHLHAYCSLNVLSRANIVACTDTHFNEKVSFLLSSLILLTSLVLTTASYTYTISTILHIPSAQGRQKAFSSCASHITVVSIAYGSNIFVYVRPNQNHSLEFDKIATVLITIVTPLLNPFIYSLRNEKRQAAHLAPHSMDVQNQTTVTEFILTAFPALQKLQIFLFVALLPALQTRAPEDALRREPHLLRLPPWRNRAPPCRPPILFLRDLLLYLDEQSPGRMMLKLKAAILPEIENFRAMFTGQKSFSYKCSAFPRAIPSFLHQAGDLIHNKGTGKRHPCLEATFLQKAAN
ncbi:hypothetical protein MG293_019743 [Ovis ammon polii]|uniref:Uncharacterized protein n=1 Tax=Ovis ammon polii TaxID=230172 RepID=A0AAD4Y0W2_OVIAM|nr:hypothetical protein MG293_019743 [Ovis ammon polii]